MRIHRPVTAAALLGAALFLPGCFNSDSSPTGAGPSDTDQQAIRYVLSDGQSTLADPAVLVFDQSQNAASAPIATGAWHRELLSLERNVVITVDPDSTMPSSAHVAVTLDAKGLLHLLVPSGDTNLEFTKDFEDVGGRSAMLLHRGESTDLRSCGWHVVSVSGVLLESPGTTRHIESVRIQSGDVDQTITNVSDLVPVENLLRLPPESEAIITVKTSDSTDQVFLHLRSRGMRMPLVSNGDGTFTGHFRTGERRGPRHLAVDVLSQGTLFDDVAAYDNVVWGIAFRVRGTSTGGDDDQGEDDDHDGDDDSSSND